MLAMPLEPRRRGRIGVLHQQRQPRARRHVDLGTDRADRRDRRDDPVHLRGRFGIVQVGRQLGPQGPRRRDQHPGFVAGQLAPDLLGDERHQRVQQVQHLGQRPRRRCLRFGARRRVVTLQDRLGEFEIPVAERAPQEVIEQVRRLVEPVGFERGRNRSGAVAGGAGDPAIDGEPCALRLEPR